MDSDTLIVNMRESGVIGAVSRVVGVKIKDEIISRISDSSYQNVLLDFSGVDFVTSGFVADLLMGLRDYFGSQFKSKVKIQIEPENVALKGTLIRVLASVARK